jgi:hypothetical protein
MVFARSFECALGAFFRREDPGAALFTEWGAYRDAALEYKKGETWDRLVHQGIHLLERFAQDDRIRIKDPQNNLQIKYCIAFQGEVTFWLMWMPSAKLMACVASSIGKPRPRATLQTLKACCRSIRN